MSAICSGSRPAGVAASAARRYYLILIALGSLLFAPPVYSHAFVRTADRLTDFRQHIRFAVAWQKDGPGAIPAYTLAHSGWELALILLNKISGISLESASFLGALLAEAIVVLVLARWYAHPFLSQDQPLWKAALLVLGVSIAAPAALLWPLDRLLYMGYVGITTYHSPTMILLRPLALVQFANAVRCFDETHPHGRWQVAAGALVCILGTLVKPSLTICLLPALALIVAWRLARKQYVDGMGLLFGIAIPAGLVLAWQFLVTYHGAQDSSIKFLPFAVMGALSNALALKFLLSILFPLSVLIINFKHASKDIRMVLGWSLFAMGLVYTYFLAETGSRFLDGNFGWSGEIALFLLFAVSTLVWLENPASTRAQKWLLAGLWGLHITFGLIYYLRAAMSLPYS